MKKLIFAALLVPIACGVCFGQVEEEGHSDIEFGYDDFNSPTEIIIESDELTDDGIQIVEGDFAVELGEAFADSPGFITIATEDPGGERVNPGDAVSVKFLDASQNSATGVGYINFYDATTGEITASTAQLSIVSQNGNTSVLTGDSVVNGVDTVLLSVGSDGTTESNSPDEDPIQLPEGEIHNHLLFTLNQETPGAYGVLFQFESEPADGGPVITSDPVWLIFNNGLNEVVFEEQAVAAFASAGEEEEGHSDIEFGYDDFNSPTEIIIESDELTDDGIQIVEGDFAVELGEAFADSPGFITIATEDPGGERVNPGDAVSVKFLDASQNSATGVGYINFYDATTGEITASTAQLSIVSQNGNTSVLTGDSVVNGVDTVLLSVGSDGTTESNSPDEDPIQLPEGEIHNHLLFTLNQETPGAYGVLFQFESEPADGGPVITSDPVWLIFNNGLDEEVFEEQAVAAFSTPSCLLGDVNRDGMVNFLDISPFITTLSSVGEARKEADINEDGIVNFLDISPFIMLLTEAGG